MIRKIVVLGWFVCLLAFSPFQSFLPISPSTAMQEKWPIRILLASQKSELTISSDQEPFLTITGSYTLPQQENRFYPVKKKDSYQNGFYTLLLDKDLSLTEARQLAVKTRNQYFQSSEIQFLIQESYPNAFNLYIGFFAEAKEADFVASPIRSLFPSIKSEKHESSENAVGLYLESHIALISPFSRSSTPYKSFVVSYTQSPCLFEKVAYPDTLEIFLYNDSLSLVNHTDIETYLRGVVGSEMPDDWPIEALKAQALASRTYAYSRSLSARQRNAYFDVTDDTNSQVYLGLRDLPRSFQAISATENQIITYQSKPIESVFHSSSGGYTENNETIWSGSPTPYLRGVPSPGEEISPHFSWYKSFSRKVVFNTLNTYLTQHKMTLLTQAPFSLAITEKGISPRVRKLTLCQDKREIILNGSDFVTLFNLKSTWFELYWYTPEATGLLPPMMTFLNQQPTHTNPEEQLYIIGRGWGHGIGMSQYGALAMAKKGKTYEEIIRHFYSSTVVGSIPSTQSPSDKLQSFQNQILFEPCCQEIKKQSFWDVTVKIKAQSSVYGFSFDIKYPKHLIELKKEDFREGTFLKSDQQPTVFLITESGNGYQVGLSREGKVGGVTGEGDLFYFRCQALESGSGVLQFVNFQALDARLEPIAFQVQTMEIAITDKDTTPPTTRITKTPVSLINQKKVYFEWIGEDDQTPVSELLYSYRINQEPWSTFSYATNVSMTLISDGIYVFSVQAKDREGNTDQNAPTYQFVLDTTPPLFSLSPYPGTTNLDKITLSGKTEEGSSVMMNGQNLDIANDGSFSVEVNLILGNNTFQFIALDKASNSTVVNVEIKRQAFQSIIITMNIGSKKAIVNDTIVTLDSAPLIKQNRTFVPLRFIAEAFGANVQWIPEHKKIEIRLDHPLVKKQIELWVDQSTAYVNQIAYTIDAAPFIIPPGRTMVPIRFIAESMESKVEWFSITQTIKITFPENLTDANKERSILGGTR